MNDNPHFKQVTDYEVSARQNVNALSSIATVELGSQFEAQNFLSKE